MESAAMMGQELQQSEKGISEETYTYQDLEKRIEEYGKKWNLWAFINRYKPIEKGATKCFGDMYRKYKEIEKKEENEKLRPSKNEKISQRILTGLLVLAIIAIVTSIYLAAHQNLYLIIPLVVEALIVIGVHLVNKKYVNQSEFSDEDRQNARMSEWNKLVYEKIWYLLHQKEKPFESFTEAERKEIEKVKKDFCYIIMRERKNTFSEFLTATVVTIAFTLISSLEIFSLSFKNIGVFIFTLIIGLLLGGLPGLFTDLLGLKRTLRTSDMLDTYYKDYVEEKEDNKK